MHTFAFTLIALSMLTALVCAVWMVVLLWRSPAPDISTARLHSRSKSVKKNFVLIPHTHIDTLNWIEKIHLGITLAFILASGVLLRALLSYDFSFIYVASYTDKALSFFYRLTAFWAGQAGSMLFWALAVVLCGTVFQLSKSYQNLSVETQLWYWTFYLSLIAFFGLLLVTWNNPFLISHSVPQDGNGLNPLLQNPGMIFHPPLLLLGYGGFVIPGCLALAQTMSSASEQELPWASIARPFTLSGWAFLTAGITLGAWWAYMELGWGGYWAWDPVENASIIPWLTATAALHILIIQKQRNKLHSYCVFLMVLTTIAAIFATYLVRSGIVQSVHAFGEGNLGTTLLTFIAVSSILAVWISIQAGKKVGSSGELAGLDSKEGFLVITAWILLALAGIILVATLWPVFTAMWQGKQEGGAIGLTADFYNRVCMPLFAGIIAILALCPWLKWGGGLRQKRYFFLVILVFLIASALAYSFGYTQPTAISGMSSGLACLLSIGIFFTEKPNHSQAIAFAIHLGIAIIAIGVAFSGPYTTTIQPDLAVGEKVKIGNFEVTFKNLYEGRGTDYVFLEGELEIAKDGKVIGISSPQRRVYHKWGQMQFAEADTLFSLGQEFYASLLAVDRNNRATFSLSLHPLVNWLWIGSAIISLLPFLLIRFRTKTMETESEAH